MDKARVLEAADLKVGLEAVFERQINAEDIEAFASLSGDRNPLHVNAEYARTTNYGRVIVHGAFQVALASTMAGMYLPGQNVVVGSYHSRFPAPLFVPSRVRVKGEIVNWSPASNSGMLRTTVVELQHSALTADILVSFSLHGRQAQATPAPSATSTTRKDRPLVIVTGAGGVLGGALAADLESQYRVIAVRRAQASSSLANAQTESVVCDLETPDWEATLDAVIGAEPVYGIVHAAWPGAPKGSLLEADAASVSRQVEFGSAVTIRLARWLGQRARERGRLAAISTTAASVKPVLGLSAYSLGKATLEHTVRLLAPELARKGITVNAVLPSFMPLGMNSTSPNRAVLAETARVPAGRLCALEDVGATVRYLLSREASFVTGQLFPLTGGQL